MLRQALELAKVMPSDISVISRSTSIAIRTSHNADGEIVARMVLYSRSNYVMDEGTIPKMCSILERLEETKDILDSKEIAIYIHARSLHDEVKAERFLSSATEICRV